MDNPATPEVEVNLNPLNELFNILTQANREQDAQIVNLVQKYFQVMEAQQKAVNEELQNIQKQLNQLTEMGEKLQNDSRIMDAVKMLEQGAKEAPEQTKQAKRTIFQKAAGIIRDFKLRGLIALNKIVQKLGLKEMYKESKVKLDGQIDKTIKAIDKLNAISYEVNEAKVHTGNIFRVLTGQEAKQNYDKAKGILGRLIKHFTKVKESYTARSEKAQNMLARIDKLEINAKIAEQYFSERKELKKESNVHQKQFSLEKLDEKKQEIIQDEKQQESQEKQERHNEKQEHQKGEAR
ncbi:MAG: hypothetical protein HFJ08_11135 [Lachnospiraceae bacterium]|nr:hypothetical protein [Lachnospiraceae bacterium]